MRRKLTSLLLALCMILTVVPTTAFATSPDGAQSQVSPTGNYGEVSVTVNRLLSKDSNATFTANLKSSDSDNVNETITLKQIPDTLKVSGNITGLASGDYTLTVTAKNYLTYTHELKKLEGNKAYDIVLYDDASVNDKYNKDQGNSAGEADDTKAYGVMAFGNFDTTTVGSENKIDDADAQAVVDGINDDGEDFDLNNDTKEDVADIAYVVRNQIGNNPANVITVASSEALKAATKGSTQSGTSMTVKDENGQNVVVTEDKVAEQITNILLSKKDTNAQTDSAETYVSLTPQKPEEEISEDNSVGLELDMSGTSGGDGQEAAPQIDAEVIAIAPPANLDNQITSGVFTVETEKDGKIEVTLTDPNKKDDSQKSENVNQKSLFKAIGGIFSKIAGAGADERNPEVTVDRNGNVIVDLGKKVAIKKVSIRVTGTKSGKLADIAKVEFLEDFEKRIPEPQLSIPTINDGTNGTTAPSNTDGKEKQLTFSWTRQPNVSGYEVSLSGAGVNFTGTTDQTEFTFESNDDNGKLKAYQTCNIKVRSISGDWKSDWSKVYPYMVQTTQAPPAPQYVNVTPGVQSLTVAWDELYDAQNWIVHYKPTDNSAAEKTAEANGSPYKITGLDYSKTYSVYVVAHNEHGDSPNSSATTGKPQNGDPVKLPTWNCINLKKGDTNPNAGNNKPENVKIESFSVEQNSFIATDRVDLIDAEGNKTSPDANNTTCYNVITDDNPNTYLKMNDWDNGVSNPGNFRIPIINLTQACEIDTIRIAPSEAEGNTITGARVRYIDPQDSQRKYAPATITKKTDSEGRVYYDIVTAEPFTAKSFSVGIQGSSPMTVSEIKLYHYDPLTKEVRALFKDSTRTELADGVTEEQITALQTKADQQSDNPKQASLKLELQYALDLKKSTTQDAAIKIDSSFNSSADSSDFAMPLTDYQPLGYVAASGDKINIFVSSDKIGVENGDEVGGQTPLKLVVSQYHPEVASWSTDVTNLCVGLNPDIEIPSVITSAKEKGGSLYICYDPKKKTSSNYTVRVQGATKIPMLNVAGMEDSQRTAAINSYVTNLQEYVENLKTNHDAHENKQHPNTNYPYAASSDRDDVYKAYGEGQECILNSTEIVMDGMMYSVPATQVLAGLKAGAESEITKAKDINGQLTNCIKAMEQEVRLFYQFKGLNANAKDLDRFPVQRLNIRYHQMFVGAFMYAGGKHIGIEWGSVPGLFGAEPFNEATGDDGHYPGWGIAHEIGHVINNKAFVRAEVTNNVFAQLERAATIYNNTNSVINADTSRNNPNYNFRTTYDKVYKAVAAGNTGHTGDLGVQLAMFWQLHLAYDDDYAYKFYEKQEDQLKNIFYARLESYLRTPSKADGITTELETKVPLTLNGNSDQNFMRAACAAAKHDILDFFRAWGFTPDDATVQYAKHFPKEDRLIQYVDDNSQLYRIQNKEKLESAKLDKSTKVSAEFDTTKTTITDQYIKSNEVNIKLQPGNAAKEKLLGYEIKRNDKVVAFVPVEQPKNYLNPNPEPNPRITYNNDGSIIYKDIVSTENNKAFVYEVTGVDHLLNATTPVKLEPEEVKIRHEGQIDKSNWTASTNMRSSEDSEISEEELKDDPDAGVTAPTGTAVVGGERFNSVIGRVINNTTSDTYTGETTEANAEIILNLGRTEQVTALKYTPGGNSPIGQYKISVSQDETTWTDVKTGTFTDNTNPTTVYFNKDGDTWMYTYDASFIKLTAVGQRTISLNELDILGPTGDNVELTQKGYGKLTENYSYSDGDEDHVIPAGSIVFHGTYKGDPSYNVVLLKDQNGHVISGDQLIFAELPEDKSGALGETADGTWLYWVAPTVKITDEITYSQKDILENVTGIQAELYRVQDALTLEGERLTSTSLHINNFTWGSVHDMTIGEVENLEKTGEPASISAMSSANADTQAKAVSSISFNSPIMQALSAEATQEETDPVKLESQSDGIHFTVDTTTGTSGDTIIGTQVSMKIDEYNEHADPAANIEVSDWTPTSVNDQFRDFVYENGTLTLYTVARNTNNNTGVLQDKITGTITNDGKFTVSGIKTTMLNSGYGRTNATSKANQSWSEKVESVILDKDILELEPDDSTKQLTATVKPDSVAANSSITFASDKPEIVEVTNPPIKNEDGTFTITLNAKSYGTATITASAHDDVNTGDVKTAICVVTVVKHVEKVTLDSESLDLKVGGTGTLAATVTPDDATHKKVTWSSAPEGIVEITENEDGTVTVTGKQAGKTTITVTTSDGSYTATCEVTVTAASSESTGGGDTGGGDTGGGDTGGGSTGGGSTGGGSTGGGSSTPPAPTNPSIPVIGGSDSEQTSVQVQDHTASIAELPADTLQAVIDGANNTPVVFDFSGLDKTVNQIQLPTNTVKALSDAAADSSTGVSGMTVNTPNGTVTFDAKALETVASQANTDFIQLHVEGTDVQTLSQAQQSATASLSPVQAVDIYLTNSNGTRISDFGIGNVIVSVPFEIPDGSKPNGFFVWYVSEDGSTLNRRPTSYDSTNKLLSFRVHHFSNYVIAYMEPTDVLNCQQDATCPMSPFTDLDLEAWYHDGVHYALANHLMIGTAENIFSPNAAVTRATVAQILYAKAGKPDVSPETSFSDVDPSAWYAKAVAWAVQYSSVAGYSNGNFGPNDPVTREQLAQMLYGAIQKPQVTGDLSAYPDQASVSSWATDAVIWATQNGIITGKTSAAGLVLDPKATAGRSQLAVMIMQYVEKVLK